MQQAMPSINHPIWAIVLGRACVAIGEAEREQRFRDSLASRHRARLRERRVWREPWLAERKAAQLAEVG